MAGNDIYLIFVRQNTAIMNYFFKITNKATGEVFKRKSWSNTSAASAMANMDKCYGECYHIKAITEAQYKKIK